MAETERTERPRNTVITNVRPFEGTQILPLSTVTISSDSGLITDISQAASPPEQTSGKVIDGHGAILLPGLIDAHVHLKDDGQLATLARWGVTTVLDMACWPEEQVRKLKNAAGKNGRADMRTAG